MSISPGTRLGVYEVLGLIGAGGMGDVYRAHDTRLDRTVAIKVLPSHLAGRPDLRERLEREARAVSSLNHPHICALFDIGHERLRPARGAGGERGDAAPPSASERGWGPASIEEDGIDYLVMEYLEGDTLEARLDKGPLPLDQAIRSAIDIADALAAAHRAGITHRDLKPGNVILTKSGPKLLDFGLAKAQPAAASFDSQSAVPTRLSPDGHWIAYATDESGRNEVYVQAFRGSGGRSQISADGGIEPVWARSGRELFYRNGDKMMAVDVQTAPIFRAGAPHVLFVGQYARVVWGEADYDVSLDGQRFLMIKGETQSPPTELHLIVNWFEELQRLLATHN